MSGHLLALSIGPVQGFIAAARRTRDLWCGSMILSEVSKAAARAVAITDGLLIFPALKKTDRALEPDSPFNVANIILAELPEGVPPEEAQKKAAEAAQARWIELATQARKEVQQYIVADRWDQQVRDAIEFYASWCLLNGQGYRTSRQRVMHLMAGRKACRDFKPESSTDRVPKSSLDGARDTVWRDEVWKKPENIRDLNRRLDRRLRLSRGEQLDAMGVTKRLAFGRQPYPSVSRIAADPWLRGLANSASARESFEDLNRICRDLTAYGLGRLGPDLFPQFGDFPFEGTAVYRSRYKELTFEMGEDEQVTHLVDSLARTVSHLVKGLGEPEPYLAVLVADGDHMGKVISRIESPVTHREFSERLALFAGKAKGIVEGSHGSLVYSGGDDVLTFVPVDKCIECAAKLHSEFSNLLTSFKTSEGKDPTLSVGIAIGHCMEPLEILLEYGRAAEKAAKHPDRNGLAIHVHTRGGSPVKVRGQWNSGILERLEQWRELYKEGRVSHKTPYDIRELARDYAGWPTGDETLQAIRDDLSRLLNKKRPGGKEKLEGEVIKMLMGASFFTGGVGTEPSTYHAGVMRLANELIVASRIVRAEQQAEGSKKEKTRGKS